MFVYTSVAYELRRTVSLNWESIDAVAWNRPSSFEKTAALFHAKLKCFPRNFQIPARRKKRFSSCILVAFVAIRLIAKYSAERISDPPVAECADCFHEDFHRDLLVFRLRDVEELLVVLSNEKSINALPFPSRASKAINDVLPGNIWYWYCFWLYYDTVTNVVIVIKNIFHISNFNLFSNIIDYIIAIHVINIKKFRVSLLI